MFYVLFHVNNTSHVGNTHNSQELFYL